MHSVLVSLLRPRCYATVLDRPSLLQELQVLFLVFAVLHEVVVNYRALPCVPPTPFIPNRRDEIVQQLNVHAHVAWDPQQHCPPAQLILPDVDVLQTRR